MATPLRELFAVLGIEVEDEALTKAGEKVEGFIGKLKLAGKAIGEALLAREVVEFFKGTVENAAHMQDLADRLGVTAGEISNFGFAAKGAGLDMETAAHTLGLLQRNLGEAAKGSKDQAAIFQKLLGPNFQAAAKGSMSLTDTLGLLADGFAKLPNQNARAAAAMAIFGRQGRALLPILAKGKEGLEEVYKEAEELGSGLGGDFYKKSKEAREEYEKFGYALDSIKDRVLSAVLPEIIKLGSWLKEHARTLIDLTKHTYILRTGMIALAVVGGFKLISTLKSVLTMLKILKPTIGETVAALGRFLLPIAIIAALYAIFDDLYTLMQGGQSVIGDTLDALFGLGTGAKLALYLNAAIEDSKRIFGDLGTMIAQGVLVPLNEVWDVLKGIDEWMRALFTGKGFGVAGEKINAMLAEMKADWMKGGQKAVAAGADLLGGPAMKVEQVHALRKAGVDPRMLLQGQLGHRVYQGAPGAPGREKVPLEGVRGGGAGKAAGTTVVHQQNRNAITIHTSSDKPEAIGKAAAGGIEQGTKRANLSAQKAANVP